MELDPILRKGIKLLHSKSKDSTEQLKLLLDEAIRQRQGKSHSFSKDLFIHKESPVPLMKQSSTISAVTSKIELKRELPTKFKDDDLYSSKRLKIDSSHAALKSHTPSPTPSIKSESSTRSRKSEDLSDSDTDANDLALEIGINCSVCKSFEITQGNQMVECQECHCLYHQECHKPTVSQQDVNDPRLVWYCAKCSRSLRKQSSVVVSANSRSASSTSKNGNSKAISSPSKPITLLKPTPFTNLATATRNLGSSSISSSLTSSSGNGKNVSASNRSGSSTTANPILSAERRVHLMKKKAAAKNAERRKI